MCQCLLAAMAETSISVAQDQFICPICLDLLKDPVTIPCGHSYCMSCITDCWNKEDQKRVYSCPQCRQTFISRPALSKNVVFAEMVDKIKAQTSPAYSASSYAGPGDVECDVCTGRKHKAVKSCLLCLNSYCQSHLKQHNSFFKDKRHNLINASGRLKKMICSQHDRLLEVYCRTDQQCVCLLCTINEHTNHDIVPAIAERTEKQNQLLDIQRKIQKGLQERDKKTQELEEAVKTHKRSAQAAVEDSERIFTELILSIERSRSEVTQMIRDREKVEVNQTEDLLKQLQQEIDDLRKRDTELNQLLHTDDHIYFLQSFQSLSVAAESTKNIKVSCFLSYDDVGKSVSMLREKLEDICKEEINKISGRVTYTEVVASSDLKTLDEFMKYSHQLTLDPNTAHKYLRLSEGNKVATFIGADQQYPVHPERFHGFSQVLCRESVNGRCYWEVEWSGAAGVGISVSYKSISRKGEGDCVFGFNDYSWRLSCSDSSCAFRHNKKAIKLPVVSSSSRIGVYVDHRAGVLSFYSVSDTMTLIHRVQTTFTQPLYPGFAMNFGSTVKLIL